MLKDDNGFIPPARQSKTRLRFYRQIYQKECQPSLLDILLKDIDETNASESKNLVLLYKIGNQGQLLGLELFCTDGAKSGNDYPTAIWNTEIPHPADSQSQFNKYEESSKDVRIFDDEDQENDEDLDIFKDGTNG